MVMIFADSEPDWKCIGPGCDSRAKDVCGFEPGSWDWVGGKGSSTVAQWGLVCEEKYKVGLVQALFFFGCMIGQFFFPFFSMLFFNFIIFNLSLLFTYLFNLKLYNTKNSLNFASIEVY